MLHDPAKIHSQITVQHENVELTEMVGNDHIALPRAQILATMHIHADTAIEQAEFCPWHSGKTGYPIRGQEGHQ